MGIPIRHRCLRTYDIDGGHLPSLTVCCWSPSFALWPSTLGRCVPKEAPLMPTMLGAVFLIGGAVRGRRPSFVPLNRSDRPCVTGPVHSRSHDKRADAMNYHGMMIAFALPSCIPERAPNYHQIGREADRRCETVSAVLPSTDMALTFHLQRVPVAFAGSRGGACRLSALIK